MAGRQEAEVEIAVTCRLCGDEFVAVNASHLWNRHDWWDDPHPVETYKARFGLRVAASEDLCKRNRQRHIEWLIRVRRHWTKTRVIRAIRKRQKQGKSLALRHVMGDGKGLGHAALRLFGCWDKALRAAGEDPAAVRLARAWSPQEVLNEILRMQRRGELRREARRPEGFRLLLLAAKRYFGSWNAALKAAGVRAIRPERGKWSRRDVKEGVQARVKEGRSLRSGDVMREDRALFKAGCNLFRKPWRGVVVELGYSYKGQRRWTRKWVVDSIRNMKRDGCSPRFQEASNTWPGITDAAKLFWGSWDGALRAAGLDPNEIRGRRKWSKEEVIREIKRLRRTGEPLNARAVFTKHSSLYNAAKVRFGQWDKALQAAGLDPARVRLRSA